MKLNLIGFLLLVLAFGCNAQQDISKKNTEAELEWFIDMEAAKKNATDNQKNILMVFAGSDWCKPCIQFKKDVLQNEKFSSQYGNQLAILYLDFPSRKKNKLPKEQTEHNEALAEKYNGSGVFPQIILLDAEMNKIKTLKYTGQSVDAFSSILN